MNIYKTIFRNTIVLVSITLKNRYKKLYNTHFDLRNTFRADRNKAGAAPSKPKTGGTNK